MSSIALVNSQLHRTLKDGRKYDRYFSNVSCKSVFLGEGVTTFGLQKMKEWTNLHYKQTLKIAKVLEEKLLSQTVLNIKQFLYDHIQYDADGFEQNLRSPNCSWQSKLSDCKSYSLFAGAILKSLKIPFSYRKITQPRSPDKWSHVYVVVKDVNGKELIIDATVPFNYEAPKIKQKDLEMEQTLPYFGLNAVEQEVVEQEVVEQEAVETVNNFRKFLSFLNTSGVSTFITQRIENEVRKYTDKGINPKVDLKPSFISINGVVISYGITIQESNGLGFIDPATLTAIAGLFSSGTFSNMFSSPSSKGITHIVNPVKNHVKNLLSSASESNMSNVLTQADMFINAYISHESKVNSRFSAVALPELRKMLSTLRESARTFMSISKNGSSASGTFPNFWSGKGNLVHAGNFTYQEYRPSITGNNNLNIGNQFNNSNTGFNPNTGEQSNFLSGLTKIANGLFQNKQTGQTYTANEVAVMQNQLPIKNSQEGNSNNKGIGTPAIIGLTVGSLVVLGLAAKKMNII